MQVRLGMHEQKLIEALVARADEDAERFREAHPGDTPNELWIENSYTAALPLAKDDAGVDLGPGPHPHLFDVYRREVATLLGERADRGERRDDELKQQPTPGEN